MSSFSDGLEVAARNAFCDISRAGVAGGLLFAGLTATTLAGAVGGLLVSAASAAAYASFCNQPLPPEGRARIPFSGGQCPAAYQVNYSLKALEIATGIVEDRTFFFRLQGPISRADIVSDPTEDNGRIFYRATGSQEDLIQELLIDYGDLPLFPNYEFFDFQVSLVRRDGLPDECGDPPLVPPPFPPGQNPVPTDITYVNNEGVTVNVPIALVFGFARVNLNGTISVPVNVRFDLDPTLNFDADLNLNTGDVIINVGNPLNPGGGTEPGGDVVVDPTVPPPPADTDTPLPPPESPDPTANRSRVIKGCFVTVSQSGAEATIIGQDSNPDIYVPALGYVSFLIATRVSSAWTADIPIKNKRQFIPCPWELGAIEVVGTPRGNSVITITPVYTTTTFNPRYPPPEV